MTSDGSVSRLPAEDVWPVSQYKSGYTNVGQTYAWGENKNTKIKYESLSVWQREM